MGAGEGSAPMDGELVIARARDLCTDLNATREAEEKSGAILRDLFGAGGDSVWIQSPFFRDYGTNMGLGWA